MLLGVKTQLQTEHSKQKQKNVKAALEKPFHLTIQVENKTRPITMKGFAAIPIKGWNEQSSLHFYSGLIVPS